MGRREIYISRRTSALVKRMRTDIMPSKGMSLKEEGTIYICTEGVPKRTSQKLNINSLVLRVGLIHSVLGGGGC